jgi:hypothetical protein
MAMLDLKTATQPSLTHEFLRRVVIELKGRTFADRDELRSLPPSGDRVSGVVKADELLHVLPEITREFAAKIKPQWIYCYKLVFSAQFQHQYESHDPISGMRIRSTRYFDVIHGDILYRFDAAFN